MTVYSWILEIYDTTTAAHMGEADTLDFNAAFEVVEGTKGRENGKLVRVLAPIAASSEEKRKLVDLGAQVSTFSPI